MLRFGTGRISRSFPPGKVKTHLAYLANTASLTEGADGPHIALVPGAKLGRVVVRRGIQGHTRVHGGLQVVALTEPREKKTISPAIRVLKQVNSIFI